MNTRTFPRMLLALLLACPLATRAADPAPDLAARFGEQDMAYTASLSPDGTRVVFVAPAKGRQTVALVVEAATGKLLKRVVASADPLGFRECDWTATDRVVCRMRGAVEVNSTPVAMTRLLSIEIGTGNKQFFIGDRDTLDQQQATQLGGNLVDLNGGTDGFVLIERDLKPSAALGTRLGTDAYGLAVERLDTRTGKATVVEKPNAGAVEYLSDGRGTVRFRSMEDLDAKGQRTGQRRHYYRAVDARDWLPLELQPGDRPLRLDGPTNALYFLRVVEGKRSLMRKVLEAAPREEVVFTPAAGAVNDVLTVGEYGRVIGATWVGPQGEANEVTEPAFRAVLATLGRALPKLPQLRILSTSLDEQVVLVWAGSDVDAGHIYVFDRRAKKLSELVLSRPELEGMTLSPARPARYTTSDGRQMGGGLRLPPGVQQPRNLPAVVIPQGLHDRAGFAWLAQFLAQSGYVVYEIAFRAPQGDPPMQGWARTAGDVVDAGRWLVSQGIADPAKLAVFGAGQGGLYALQANLVDPQLFRAVVTVGALSDLQLWKDRAQMFTNGRRTAEFIGSGAHVREGSPAQNAARFQAPVLMFHAQMDFGVDEEQSRRMDRALGEAGKGHELVVIPGVDADLRDGTARGDMLRRMDAFLRAQLKP